MTSTIKSTCRATITSRFDKHNYNLQLHAIPVLVNVLPSQAVSCNNFSIPKHIYDCLADPQFHIPGAVDILLGAEVFFDALSTERWILSNSAALHRT